MIDAHNMIFRCLYVANQMDAGANNWESFKYIFTNTLHSTVKRFSPDHLIIAIDQGKSWRKKLYPDYKGGRKEGRDESPIDFDAFFAVVEELLVGLQAALTSAYFLRIPNVEADDIIGILTEKLQGNEVTAITTDKDMYQLFKYPGYRQWNPITKKYIEVLSGKVELQVKLLTGDKSDNIPSVMPRMGIKTAEKWLDRIDELLEDPVVEKQYILNRQLIDFTMIPEKIKTDIIDLYLNYDHQPLNGRNSYNYFANSMPKVLTYLQELNNTFSGLQSYNEMM